MKQYISKSALIAEIKRLSQKAKELYGYSQFNSAYDNVLESIKTLEVKEVGDNPLDKFKSLQHITKDLHKTIEDWGYAPNLYHFDGSWHVDWISCEEGDSIKEFSGDTPEKAIDEAYNWFHSTFCNN